MFDRKTLAHAADCAVCEFTRRHVPAVDPKPGAVGPLHRIDQIRTWPPSEGGERAMVLMEPEKR